MFLAWLKIVFLEYDHRSHLLELSLFFTECLKVATLCSLQGLCFILGLHL